MSIVRKKIRNTVYVYDVKSFRDKTGRVRTKWKILGKEGPDGVLIASKKRVRRKNYPANIKKVRTITDTFLLENIEAESEKAGESL